MRWAWIILLAVLLAVFLGLAAANDARQKRGPGATASATLKEVPSAATLPAPYHPPASTPSPSAEPVEKLVAVPAAKTATGCRLFGTVMRGGLPQSDLQVRVYPYRDEDAIPLTTRTDMLGRYEVTSAPTGAISVCSGGVVEWLYVPSGLDEIRQDLWLPDGAISGRVCERGTKKPIRMACVTAYSVDESRESITPRPPRFATLDSTDERGNYLLEGLPGGKYELRVHLRRCPEQVYGVVTLEPRGARDGVDIYIGDPVRISGHVLDASSRPIRGATVTLQDIVNGDPTLPPVKTVSCDDEGNFLFDDVTVGPYRATAAATGYGTAVEAITVDREGREQDFFLRIEATLRIHVKDARGRAVEGAALAITDSSGEVIAPLPLAPDDPGPFRSGPNGEIQRYALREGPYRGEVTFGAAHATFDFKAEEGRETLLEITLAEGN